MNNMFISSAKKDEAVENFVKSKREELEIRYGGFCARYSDGRFCLHYEIDRSEELDNAVPV